MPSNPLPPNAASPRPPTRPDTGEVLTDLPSPYIPHACGLLHLPRFLAKIRKHLDGKLPKSYQRNFTKGFDGFLCLHLGVDPQEVISAVRESESDQERDRRLMALFPEDLSVAKWNRELILKGMSDTGKEALDAAKKRMEISHRKDLHNFCDMIDFDEGRIP